MWLGSRTSGPSSRAEKPQATGWVVEVAIQRADTPKFAYFNVAIDVPDKAIAAASKRCRVLGARVSVVRQLTALEVASLKLRRRDVRQA